MIVSSNYLFFQHYNWKKEKTKFISAKSNISSKAKIANMYWCLNFDVETAFPILSSLNRSRNGAVLKHLSFLICHLNSAVFFSFSFSPKLQLPSVWVQWSVISSRIAQVHLLHIRTGTAACSIAWCQGCVEDDWRLRAGRTCSSLRCTRGDGTHVTVTGS